MVQPLGQPAARGRRLQKNRRSHRVARHPVGRRPDDRGTKIIFMVKSAIRLASLAAVALLPIFHLSAKNLNDYQLGDVVEEDIVATSKISVVDPEGTQAMKDKEAARVPVVVRYY